MDVDLEETKKMSLKRFKELCGERDYNIVDMWDEDHFKIVCSECKSKDILVFFREESGMMGSEYTGYMKGFNWSNGVLVKCKKCGNAMEIRLP